MKRTALFVVMAATLLSTAIPAGATVVQERECVTTQSWTSSAVVGLTLNTSAPTISSTFSAACQNVVVNTASPFNPLTVTPQTYTGSSSWNWAGNCALMLFGGSGFVGGGAMVGSVVAVHYRVDTTPWANVVVYAMVPSGLSFCANSAWTGNGVGILNPIAVT